MRVAAALAVLLGLASLAFGALFPLHLATRVPEGDIIDFYHQFLSAGGFAGYGFDHLYQWHNEHRLVLPKLWFLADIAVAEGRQTLLLTVIFASAMAHAALLTFLFRGLGVSRTASFVAFIVAAGAMASPVQFENLVHGFQVQFIQVWLFASLAVAMIAWAPVGAGRPVALGLAVMLAMLFGLASSYSMINGLAVWPLLVVFAVWRRLPFACLIPLAALGGAVIALEVFSFLSRPDAGARVGVGADLLNVVLFSARYVTSAIGEIGSLGQDIVGIIAIAGVIAAGLYGLFRRGAVSEAQMVLLAICAFVIGAAVTTAFGRLNGGPDAANSSRYTTPSMVFLVSVGMLAFARLHRTQRRWVSTAVTVAGVILLLVPGLVHGVQNYKHHLAGRDLADLAAVSHLASGYRPETLSAIYPHWPPLPDLALQQMQDAGLGPFSQPWRYRPPASARGPEGASADVPECDGTLERLRIDPVNGVTFAARLTDLATGRTPPWVVARAREGEVVAWGAALEPRHDHAPMLGGSMFERGFRAFGPAPEPMIETVTVEGVFEDGTRCRLPGVFVAESPRFVESLPPTAVSAAAGGWTFVGERLAGQTGTAEVPQAAMPVFGSMSLPDRAFDASIALTDPAGANALMLPLHTETRPFGTTITLNAADGRVVDRILLTRPANDAWVWLVMRAPDLEPGMSVRIRTVERHPWNGLAFGQPHWVP